jgi:hypothetical protein
MQVVGCRNHRETIALPTAICVRTLGRTLEQSSGTFLGLALKKNGVKNAGGAKKEAMVCARYTCTIKMAITAITDWTTLRFFAQTVTL